MGVISSNSRTSQNLLHVFLTKQLEMHKWSIFCRHGWRQAALVNTALVALLTIVLACLVGAIAARTGSLYMNLTFYSGTCDATAKLNLILHLLINIIATGLIASSSFFMQVLNAPSRAEVDAAHRRHKTLSIGVRSLGNLLHVSWFKVAATAVFMLSSLPIHLLFNSAVFETETQGRDWQLIYAAESFVHGGAFALPGAYLAPSGFWPDFPHLNMSAGQAANFEHDLEQFLGTSRLFGAGKNLTEYQNVSSPVVGNITRAARTAAGWTRLSPLDCRQEYIYCQPRSRYGNVVMVLNMLGAQNTTGWTRDEVFPAMLSDNVDFWDEYGIARDVSNSLWWSAECGVTKDPLAPPGVCRNLCAEGMGTGGYYEDGLPPPYPVLSTEANWTIFMDEPSRRSDKTVFNNTGETAVQPFMFASNQTLELQHRSGFDFAGFNQWNISYCLAEEIEDQCKLGASGIILLLVTLCATVKTIQCIVVLLRLREDPLVTPGDAIESFLLYPDAESRSLCAVGHNDYLDNRKEKKPLETLRGPRRWKGSSRFVFSAIRLRSWLTTYILILAGLIFAGHLLRNAMRGYLAPKAQYTPETYTGFDHSLQNGAFDAAWVPWGRFLPSVIVANLAQLIVSCYYFAYNGVWTELVSEIEWNSFARRYQPLRVSNPKGGQVSTYRLQLPFLFGIPLVVGSILLHWLVSNAIYVVMVEGEYLTDSNFQSEYTMGFHGNTYINIGFSTGPILISIIVSSVIAALPIVFAFVLRLRGDMPLSRNSSLIIAAACHILPTKNAAFSPPRTPRAEENMAESETLIGRNAGAYGQGSEVESRTAMSQGKLRWGVANVKETAYESYKNHKVMVGHLSFAGEDEDVLPPENGRWYE